MTPSVLPLRSHPLQALAIFPRCVWSARRARRLMARGGLSDVLNYVAAEEVAPAPSGVPAAVLLRWVELACTLQKGQTACLLRAVVGARVLKRAGIDVSLQLGVAMDPYRGHAWLEVQGEPVGKDAEIAAAYTVIRRVH